MNKYECDYYRKVLNKDLNSDLGDIITKSKKKRFKIAKNTVRNHIAKLRSTPKSRVKANLRPNIMSWEQNITPKEVTLALNVSFKICIQIGTESDKSEHDI